MKFGDGPLCIAYPFLKRGRESSTTQEYSSKKFAPCSVSTNGLFCQGHSIVCSMMMIAEKRGQTIRRISWLMLHHADSFTYYWVLEKMCHAVREALAASADGKTVAESFLHLWVIFFGNSAKASEVTTSSVFFEDRCHKCGKLNGVVWRRPRLLLRLL